jgi:hypothetical protein
MLDEQRTYNGSLYKCITAITAAEAWSPAKWQLLSGGGSIADIYIVVASLPATGETNKIYLVPSTSGTNGSFDEYLYVNNSWEPIANGVSIDLSNYYTKTETDANFAPKSAGNPAGGAAGQVLQKTSGTDYDFAWATLAAGGGSTNIHISRSAWDALTTPANGDYFIYED